MLLRYLVFCLGCSMLQTAAGRTPRTPILEVPLLFMNPRMYNTVQFVGLSSVIAELVVGFALFSWWGLVIWLPFIWSCASRCNWNPLVSASSFSNGIAI